jgi:hypothetical protein
VGIIPKWHGTQIHMVEHNKGNTKGKGGQEMVALTGRAMMAM